jgi:hypothetical protein
VAEKAGHLAYIWRAHRRIEAGWQQALRNNPVSKHLQWPSLGLGLLLLGVTACEPLGQGATHTEPGQLTLAGRWRDDSSHTWLFSPTHQLLASAGEACSCTYTRFDTAASSTPIGGSEYYTRQGDTLLRHERWRTGASSHEAVVRSLIKDLSPTRLTLRLEINDPDLKWVFEYYYSRAPDRP